MDHAGQHETTPQPASMYGRKLAARRPELPHGSEEPRSLRVHLERLDAALELPPGELGNPRPRVLQGELDLIRQVVTMTKRDGEM